LFHEGGVLFVACPHILFVVYFHILFLFLFLFLFGVTL